MKRIHHTSAKRAKSNKFSVFSPTLLREIKHSQGFSNPIEVTISLPFELPSQRVVDDDGGHADWAGGEPAHRITASEIGRAVGGL